jgi:Flp pilus assembly protein TadB
VRIQWFRPTPKGVEPYAFPLFCCVCGIGIVVGAVTTAIALVAGWLLVATASAFIAAAGSALLLWGSHQARRQELFLERITLDIEASHHTATMSRWRREFAERRAAAERRP